MKSVTNYTPYSAYFQYALLIFAVSKASGLMMNTVVYYIALRLL
jgi:hypothetical protein